MLRSVPCSTANSSLAGDGVLCAQTKMIRKLEDELEPERHELLGTVDQQPRPS